MTKAQQWGMLPSIPTMDSPKEPTSGYLDNRTTTVLAKDWSPDDWLLENSRHGSVSSG